MSKYYYGYFRSIDTSIDPDGQLYKVLIFTDVETGVIPYPTKFVFSTLNVRPVTIPDDDNMIELKMASHPFVLSYETSNVKDNKYSPYKCSKAEISFMQSEYNQDFLDVSGKRNLVVLLRRKNEISLIDNGLRYYNSVTGETLDKKAIFIRRPSASVRVWPTNAPAAFIPEEEDAFCYNIEWVGYVTPETFSLSYSHVEDKFTVVAQDALSTLQYDEYEYYYDKPVIISLQDILLNFIKKLRIYKKIYITDTVKMPGNSDPIFKVLWEQQYNNFDEEDKPKDKFSVLEYIMNYLNLQMVPIGDCLYITNLNAIAEGFNTYKVFAFNDLSDSTLQLLPWMSSEYVEAPSEYVSLDGRITKDDFTNSASNISTTSIFNKVKVKIDEYPVGETLPDLSKDDNVVLKGDFTNSNMYNNYFWEDANTRHYYYWEYQALGMLQKYNQHMEVETYYYDQASPQNQDGWYINFSHLNENPTWFGWGNTLQNTPFCTLIDDGGLHHGTEMTLTHALSNKYNPTRKLWMNCPLAASGKTVAQRNTMVQNNEMQYYAHFKTKEMLLTTKHYLQLEGQWGFFCATTPTAWSGIPAKANVSHSGGSWVGDTDTVYGPAMWVPMKIKCGNYWLKNGNGFLGAGHYTWSKTEHICKVFLNATPGETKAWGNLMGFENTIPRMGTGWYIPIDYSARVMADTEVVAAPIEVWIGRPYGVTSGGYIHAASLEGFNIKIVTWDDIVSTHQDTTNANTEFEMTMDETSYKEMNAVNLGISSINDHGPRYSQAVYKLTEASNPRTVPEIYNAATAQTLLAESHIITNNVDQFKDSCLILNTAVKRKFKPIARVTWSHFEDKVFILSSSKIDYEYETMTCDLVEMKKKAVNVGTATAPAEPYSINYRSTIRNYMRTNDVLMRDRNEIAANRTEVSTFLPPSTSFSMNYGNQQGQNSNNVYLNTDNQNIADFRVELNFDEGFALCSIPDVVENMIDIYINNNNELIVESLM